MQQTLSASGFAISDTQAITWNCQELELRPDSHLLIRPNFKLTPPTGTTKAAAEKQAAIDLALRIKKNSEIPFLLQEAGELNTEEDKAIQYHKYVSEQNIYVGKIMSRLCSLQCG